MEEGEGVGAGLKSTGTAEKKMADLKENIDAEVQSAKEEYLKMESHIKLYITEMEQSLV